MSDEVLVPDKNGANIAAQEKQLKRLNTKTNGFAAGSSIINSGLFVQNMTTLKIILNRKRRCEIFCAPLNVTEEECGVRVRYLDDNCAIFIDDLSCDFFLMRMIIVSI